MSDPLLEQLLRAIEAGQPAALVTVVRATGAYAPALGQRALLQPGQPPLGELSLGGLSDAALADAAQTLAERQSKLLGYSRPEGDAELFVEVQHQPPTLIIVGAGHVALPLAQLGKLIDFDVVVLDDRPTFANRQRFPMADTVLARPFRATLRDWPITNDTYIVLVTRGHSHDVECLLEVLDSPARYIGMIGSKRRVGAVFQLLETEMGIDPAKFDKVWSPIGLDIGAETPAEIAVAIIAEIINVHRGGRAVSLASALRENRRLPLHPGRVND
ncbi:MAG: XdhC/CoxI family protein [Anaerolineae bacterium]